MSMTFTGEAVPAYPQRFRLIWEAFNLVNRDNINLVTPIYYSVSGRLRSGETFGRPLASAGERIRQLAVRVTF